MSALEYVYRISDTVAEAASGIRFKEVEEVNASSYGTVMGTLLLLLALFYLGIFLYKKYDLGQYFRIQTFNKEKQVLEVVSSKVISQRTRLTLVKYRDKELLIAEHTHGVTLLDSQKHKDLSENNET